VDWLLLVMLLAAADSDRDGVADAVEQAILEQFRPQLLISAGECDGLPAEFKSGLKEPEVAARNGTLYARVSPFTARPGEWIEVHYYHLWGRDCGKRGHDLDAEQAAVLLERVHGEWLARYWWAAAHEETLCERSNAARASWLNAERQGARLWISRGKHASFLSRELCSWGCGGDSCENTLPAAPAKIVNLGEKGALAEGMKWVEAGSWPLRDKLGSAFTPEILARLDREEGSRIVGREGAMYPIQAIALAGGEAADGLGTGKQHTGKALGRATEKTGSALRKAGRSVRGFLSGEK
jgi:hypothetical protein